MTKLTVLGPKSVPFEAFKAFSNKYTRATRILGELYELSLSQIFNRVCSDRIRFERFKFEVKFLWLWLNSATSQQMNDCEAVTAVLQHGKAVWLAQRLNYCPSLEKIAGKYLTDVKWKKGVLAAWEKS